VAALGGTSFQRNVASFQPIGFEAERQQNVWRVTAVADPETGIQPGDEILSVHDQSPGDLEQLHELLRSRAEGPIILLRDGAIETPLYRRPDLQVDVPYLVLTVIGIGYLLIGLYTAFKDRQLQARLFFFWCLASLALYVLSPLRIPQDFTDELIFLVDQLARNLLPALTLHLFLVFPSRLLSARHSARVVPFIYLPSVLLIGFHIDQIYGGQRIFGPVSAQRIEWVSQAEIYYLVASALAAVLLLFFRFEQRPSWENRRQVQWILFGMLGGYVPFLVLYVIPSSLALSWPSWTTVLAVLPLALVPLAFSWAILKFKLLDIGPILRDSIAYSMTILVGLLGFSLINVAIRQGMADDLSLARNLLTFAAGVVVAGVLAPTRDAISSGLERLQFGSVLSSRRELSNLGQELLHERDLDRLCSILIDRLADGLVSRANLYLAQGGAMVPVEPRAGLPREIPFGAFGAEFWHRDVESISAIQLPSEETTAQQRLFTAGYRYAFPLTVREHRIGIALVSYKFDDEPLSSEDLDLARGLLNQASLAIENAQLLEEVHSQLLEVTRLEEHQQGILESSPAGIAVVDLAGKVVSANHAFAVVASAPRPEVIGKTLGELVPISPLPSPEDGVVEVSYCLMSGEERHLQLSLASYQRRAESGLRVLVIQDLTDRVNMEQELKEKERLASLGMLAAGVAHEVNTPLTGISSYAQLLLSDVAESDPQYEILKKMERQTFRAAQIVNNLLEFARNRRDELVPVPVDAVLDECVQLLADRANGCGVEIGWQRPAEPLVVLGNDGELHQVFTNLVVNALDAMGKTGGRLELKADRSDRRIRVRISDTGPGIPAERIDRIFHPFFSSKIAQGGSGLGLAITANIVRRHAGEIRVDNHTESRGCTFSVELPRHDA
ncbi:MAG: ATP-binding protein, partial [Acidobacteriota bacterium]